MRPAGSVVPPTGDGDDDSPPRRSIAESIAGFGGAPPPPRRRRRRGCHVCALLVAAAAVVASLGEADGDHEDLDDQLLGSDVLVRDVVLDEEEDPARDLRRPEDRPGSGHEDRKVQEEVARVQEDLRLELAAAASSGSSPADDDRAASRVAPIDSAPPPPVTGPSGREATTVVATWWSHGAVTAASAATSSKNGKRANDDFAEGCRSSRCCCRCCLPGPTRRGSRKASTAEAPSRRAIDPQNVNIVIIVIVAAALVLFDGERNRIAVVFAAAMPEDRMIPVGNEIECARGTGALCVVWLPESKTLCEDGVCV
eukprot:CAMPEP_0197179970 /NCGR_PEP_ID=MMETSP1423-20130617/4756_1 /TAXON_ID=476441 /ORGANISM="Pseudo-nitzschia heimii, Strain UNC1101" /LENGTH=311 /DNA_ID=CAMNT_0042629981 /DNA_START=118 /DNA_END=1054 /DNA_ORIENTATION=-